MQHFLVKVRQKHAGSFLRENVNKRKILEQVLVGKKNYNCIKNPSISCRTISCPILKLNSSVNHRKFPAICLLCDVADKSEPFCQQRDTCAAKLHRSFPFCRCSFKPLSIQATFFSASKIWYQHRLPPVSLGEAELYRLPDGEMRPRQPLWCVRRGLSHRLWLYSRTVRHVGSLAMFLRTWCAKIIVSLVSGNETH